MSVWVLCLLFPYSEDVAMWSSSGAGFFIFLLPFFFNFYLWWEIYPLLDTSPVESTQRQAFWVFPWAAHPFASVLLTEPQGVWRPWLPALHPAPHPGCVLSPSTRSRDTAAKCCLPSSCWTTRVLFLEVTTGPSNSGIYAAKSVRKFSLCLWTIRY